MFRITLFGLVGWVSTFLIFPTSGFAALKFPESPQTPVSYVFDTGAPPFEKLSSQEMLQVHGSFLGWLTQRWKRWRQPEDLGALELKDLLIKMGEKPLWEKLLVGGGGFLLALGTSTNAEKTPYLKFMYTGLGCVAVTCGAKLSSQVDPAEVELLRRVANTYHENNGLPESVAELIIAKIQNNDPSQIQLLNKNGGWENINLGDIETGVRIHMTTDLWDSLSRTLRHYQDNPQLVDEAAKGRLRRMPGVEERKKILRVFKNEFNPRKARALRRLMPDLELTMD